MLKRNGKGGVHHHEISPSDGWGFLPSKGLVEGKIGRTTHFLDVDQQFLEVSSDDFAGKEQFYGKVVDADLKPQARGGSWL